MRENNKKRKIKMNVTFFTLAFILVAQDFSGEDITGQIFTELMGFQLEADSINTVRSKYGQTKIYKDGDASESSTRINYYVKAESCYITFDSGEMGGGEIITCFILRAKSSGEEYKTLSDLEFSKTDLGGLRIGMDLKDFKRRIGNGYEAKNNRVYKAFFTKLDMSPFQIENFKEKGINVDGYPYWDIVVNVIGTFHNSTLMQLNVCKTVTN